ncbi:MAG: hypothetical protein MJY82_09620 [Fibrobacter sp.]|nr:hypothetical protein [Fibrobacter sp.]
MSKKFKHIFESANANKKLFDASVEGIKDALNTSISKVYTVSPKQPIRTYVSTGWLRGSLSYPWVVVCIIIPAILEVIV